MRFVLCEPCNNKVLSLVIHSNKFKNQCFSVNGQIIKIKWIKHKNANVLKLG